MSQNADVEPPEPMTADNTAVLAAGKALREAERAAAEGGSKDAVRAAREAWRKACRSWDPYLPHRPFLDAIDATPHDPKPVLAWAEWLKEHDDGLASAAAVGILAEAGVLPRKEGNLWVMKARAADKLLYASRETACGLASTAWLAIAEHEPSLVRPRRGETT
jgi:uncharacterized protein (TIGR02996 family)